MPKALISNIHGDDAYELAVKNGFQGDMQAWLTSLEGEVGFSPFFVVTDTHIQVGYQRGTEVINPVDLVSLDDLRPEAGSARWDTILNKPDTFPPADHKHPASDIEGFVGDITKAEAEEMDTEILRLAKEHADNLEVKPTSEFKEHTYTEDTSLAVKDDGTYLLHATSTQTVTFTGAANGSSIAIVSDFPFRVAGTTYSAGLHVGLLLPSGWDIITVRESSIAIIPDPVITLTGITQTTASVAWTAVLGATSYLARVNGAGSGVDIGNVITWTAEGLPAGQTGTIGIRAVGLGGMSDWVTASYTTSTMMANVLRMTRSHTDSTTETGNATAGYNYIFNGTPYGEGLTSNYWRIPAGTDGFAQSVVTASTTGGLGFHFADAGQSPHGGPIPSTVGISVPVIGGGGTYTAAADPPQPASELVAEVGDIIRIGRTGTTLWVRVSKNGGSTFTEIYSRLSTVNGSEAMPNLFLRVSGANFSGTLSNVRGVGWVSP